MFVPEKNVHIYSGSQISRERQTGEIWALGQARSCGAVRVPEGEKGSRRERKKEKQEKK